MNWNCREDAKDDLIVCSDIYIGMGSLTFKYKPERELQISDNVNFFGGTFGGSMVKNHCLWVSLVINMCQQGLEDTILKICLLQKHGAFYIKMQLHTSHATLGPVKHNNLQACSSLAFFYSKSTHLLYWVIVG